MSSRLSSIPVEKRRQLAATLGLFAALFVAIGVVALTGRPPAAVRAFSAVALVVAVALALTSWGVAHTARLDAAEQRLDRAIDAAVAEHPDLACDCGHDHDVDELHVTDSCAHDGSGTDCSHSCDTCVVASMRPSPTQPRSERL